MQNKGAIRLFAILLAIISLYQLLFTFGARSVEGEAENYAKLAANGNLAMEQVKLAEYLDSVSGETALNLLLVKFTYKECKEKEINLGLDLRGGMNLVLEVKISDILKALSNYNTDATFQQALRNAEIKEKTSSKDFIELFGEEFSNLDPNAKLSVIFSTPELKGLVNYNMTNQEVLNVINQEATHAVDNAFNILRNRIDRFGVTQPNIQRLGKSGRVLIELPGIKDPKRVRKLLQGTASLEFWECYENNEVYQIIGQANTLTVQTKTVDSPASTETEKTDAELSLLSQFKSDSSSLSTAGQQTSTSLFSYLTPSQMPTGPVVGYALARDTSNVNQLMALEAVKNILPADLKLLWSVKSITNREKEQLGFKVNEDYYELVAIKVTSIDGRPRLEGDVITSASAQSSSQQGNFEVSMSMNGEGAAEWARITGANEGKCIAIVLDGYVYSYPRVNEKISGGHSSITGNFTVQEAQDLANILKSGKLPAPARIVEDNVVGPSLGQEAINAGLWSCVIAFFVVLVFMVVFYNRAGWIANFALITNVFFIFGVLASFGAVLTLPGLAGITLTMGMAVDANVIIYERIREEIRAGKGMSLAIADGFKHAYSAIIDGNLTTMITGIILLIFGTGPIQGFATTLIIGLITSFFTAIFISRLVFDWMIAKNYPINFGNKYTNNFLSKVNIDFIGIRKILYGVSIVIILVGLVSVFTSGFNYGVDFVGGRTYVVRYNQSVSTSELHKKLLPLFDNQATEVKTFGNDNQVRITTKYLIEDDSNIDAEGIIVSKLYEGSKYLLDSSVSQEQFSEKNIMSSQKVGPSISHEIMMKAVWAVIFSLIGIFLYIFIRFKDWRYGLGGVISLAHDTLIVIGAFSLLKNVMPFSMEVDSAFIAAVLTVIGYSINDTVIIYDRIREWRAIHPKWELKEMFNGAMNSTLGRTINTSLTVLFVLIVIFIFGGEVIRGFIFAMLIGIGFGTYSSIFNAAPIVYDTLTYKRKKKQ